MSVHSHPAKKVSSRELRRVLEQTQVGLSVLAQSVGKDFETAGAHMTATRELCVSLAGRLDAVERQVRQLITASMVTHAD